MTTKATGNYSSGDVVDKGLKAGALGLVSSVVIGVASMAPAYSLAATIGFVVIGVGLQAPIVMVLAFIPMYCVAVGYKELNEAEPDCGHDLHLGDADLRAARPAGWAAGRSWPPTSSSWRTSRHRRVVRLPALQR